MSAIRTEYHLGPSGILTGAVSSTTRLPRADDIELGQRLRAARTEGGYSQEQVAAALAIPRSAVSLIESGERSLASSELARLSQIFKWPAESLLFGRRDPDGAPEQSPREGEVLRYFRAAGSLGAADEKWLKSAEDQWVTYADLEAKLFGSQRWELPTYPALHGRAYEQGERLAQHERRRLGMGVAPIRSMIALLEGEGVKVLMSPFPPAQERAVSGAYFFSKDLGPCVLVNENELASRRRFTEAHEYCHFLIDRELTEGEICSHDRRREPFEMRANAFAAAFLMPAGGIQESLEDSEVGNVGPEDAVHLMFRFGVSHQAILWRLVNLRWITQGEREELTGYSAADLARQLGYTHEPGETEASPDRFQRLAVEAWRNGQIDDRELAEIARLSKNDVARLFGGAHRKVKKPSRRPLAEPDWL